MIQAQVRAAQYLFMLLVIFSLATAPQKGRKFGLEPRAVLRRLWETQPRARFRLEVRRSKKKKEDGVSHMSHGAAVSRDGSTNHEELNLTDRVVNV